MTSYGHGHAVTVTGHRSQCHSVTVTSHVTVSQSQVTLPVTVLSHVTSHSHVTGHSHKDTQVPSRFTE